MLALPLGNPVLSSYIPRSDCGSHYCFLLSVPKGIPRQFLGVYAAGGGDVSAEVFKKFAAKQLDRKKKPSIRKALADFREKAKQIEPKLAKRKNKDSG